MSLPLKICIYHVYGMHIWLVGITESVKKTLWYCFQNTVPNTFYFLTCLTFSARGPTPIQESAN